MNPMSPHSIRYHDGTHSYYGANGKRYVSASQLVDRFSNKFDAEAVSEDYAVRAGRTAEFWVDKWDGIRDVALERGNRIHNAMEEMVNGMGSIAVAGKAHTSQNPDRFLPGTPYIQWPDGVYTEQILWNHEYKVAGRSDKFIIETIGKKRYFHVDDYKSNKYIKMFSFKDKDGYRKMKAPLNHLMDCDYFKYCMQLSTYMLMAELMGFTVGRITLIHFPHVPEIAPQGAVPPPPQHYQLPYLKKEVISALNYINNNG